MKRVLILGVLAILLAAAAYYSLFSVPKQELSPESAEPTAEEVEFATGPKTGTGSLEDLLEMNLNMGCFISYQPEDQSEAIEGDIFVSEGNLRGDFLTQSPDLTGRITSSMIIVDAVMYVWSEIEGESYGVKIDMATPDDTPTENTGPVALDSVVTYECFDWFEVEDTLFEPPGDVLFQDMGELMKSGIEEGVIYEEGAEMPI